MLRSVKLPSLTSGPFTGKNNRVEFELDMGTQYDLSKAYLNLYCNVETT